MIGSQKCVFLPIKDSCDRVHTALLKHRCRDTSGRLNTSPKRLQIPKTINASCKRHLCGYVAVFGHDLTLQYCIVDAYVLQRLVCTFEFTESSALGLSSAGRRAWRCCCWTLRGL
ncbi:pituitary homeobox 2 [Biomphalaria glabrata]|nr:pituitary homeobox 2 [Biomphalaria glabrata]